MVATVGNWVGEVTATAGTGSIALNGPVEGGYIRFSDTVPDGSEVWYTIIDGENRESGVGTLDGNILERTAVHETLANGIFSDNAPLPLSLSGLATVFSTMNKGAFDMFAAQSIGTSIIHHPDEATAVAASQGDTVNLHVWDEVQWGLQAMVAKLPLRSTGLLKMQPLMERSFTRVGRKSHSFM